MLRKLYSRRGFTIVEVLVAFVIFAIMAGMVAMIVNATMQAKQNNTVVEEQITQQKQAYFQKSHPMEKKDYEEKVKDASAITGTVNLDFQKQSGSAGKVNVKYVAVDVDGSDSNLELEYYLGQYGNNSWTATKSNKEKGGDNEDEVLGGLTCGVYGSAGIESVKVSIDSKVRDDGKTRYYIYVVPVSSKLMGGQMDSFKQIRLIFPSDILRWGYINYNNGHEDGGSVNNANAIISIPSNKNTIRISGDGGEKSIFSLSSTAKPVCWIELETPIDPAQLSDPTKIFGTSGENGISTETCTSLTTGNTLNVVNYQRFSEYEKDEDGNFILDSDGNKILKEYLNVFAATREDKS